MNNGLISQIYGYHEDFLVDYVLTSIFEVGLSGVIVYFTLSSLLFLYFYVWNEHKYFPKNADPNWTKGMNLKGGSFRTHVLSEIKTSLINIITSVPINGFFHTLVKRGHTKIYYSISQYGWSYLCISIACLIVWTEFWVYWAHYILHHKKLFFLHRPHHSFIMTTPFCAWSFHPIDSFMQALPHYLFPFLMPLHFAVYLVDLVYLGAWAALIHDQVSFIFLGGLTLGSTHHEIHHLYLHYNYGQWTTIMDRLMGTYRPPLKPEERVQTIKQASEWATREIDKMSKSE